MVAFVLERRHACCKRALYLARHMCYSVTDTFRVLQKMLQKGLTLARRSYVCYKEDVCATNAALCSKET